MPWSGRRPRPRLGLALAAAAAFGCVTDRQSVGPGTVAAIAVAPAVDSVAVGDSLQLIGVAYDDNGIPYVGAPMTWSSSDAAIATVSATGVVTGVAPGPVTITAANGALTSDAQITVGLPLITADRDTVIFRAVANGPDPAEDTVAILNGSVGTLDGLAVGTVSYPFGGGGWLTATLDATVAPARLALVAQTGSLAVGLHVALVPITSPAAGNSPRSVPVAFILGVDSPSQVAVQAGNGQSATVNTAVGVPPAVIVRDQYSNPVPGVEVVFAVTGGGGAVTGGTDTTDAGGIASVTSWTLGTAAGANGLAATVIALPPVAFSATGTPDVPAALVKVAGDGQSAIVGSSVPTAPAVRVDDQFGNPVPGVGVTFATAAGNGSVTGANPTSDAAGVATVGSWTLGTGAGTDSLTASVGGVPDAVFTATAIAGSAAFITLAGGDNQTDTVAATLPVAYTVQVTDSNGNGVAGITVGWSVTAGGGSITPNSMTDPGGFATATRVLGTIAGTQTAQGAVGGLVGSPVGFTATATAGDASSIAIDAGNNQTATVNTAVAIDPSVIVTDQFGNPKASVSVTFAVTGGGGTVNPTTAIATDAAGIAQVTSWTLGTVAGTNNNTLNATSVGLVGSPRTFTASATAGAATQLAITTQPAGATSNVNFTTQPVVQLRDQFGNDVSQSNVAVTAAVFSGTGTLGGTAAVNTNASGQAVFATLRITGMLTGYGNHSLRFTSGSLTAATSGVFTVLVSYAYNIQGGVYATPSPTSTCLDCHAWLSYTATVNVASSCSGLDYIEPNNTTNSYIYRKLAGTQPCGGVMPPAGSNATYVDIVGRWINQGAPNN
jgi:adhesin/invasin